RTDGRTLVAPSRGRGSKLAFGGTRTHHRSRPLTGARIETSAGTGAASGIGSPPHGGADRNVHNPFGSVEGDVAPSRGRGSKLDVNRRIGGGSRSPPHGGAD